MAESDKIVSIITCDTEGRIETFNENAEKLFGYSADEVIAKKRVSLFSPGMVVLGHVANWLKKARQNKEGYTTKTTFIRKDGTQFAAEFTCTATNNSSKVLELVVSFSTKNVDSSWTSPKKSQLRPEAPVSFLCSMNALNGAIPVPGPTIIMSFEPSSGITKSLVFEI